MTKGLMASVDSVAARPGGVLAGVLLAGVLLAHGVLADGVLLAELPVVLGSVTVTELLGFSACCSG